MARCIDLFIDGVAPDGGWRGGLTELAAELGTITGLRLNNDAGSGTWVAIVDGARVVLAEHDLVDDHHLTLSHFRYHLFARVRSADAGSTPEAALLRRLLGLVKADGRFRALLVWDLQNIVDQGGDRPRG